MSAVPYGWDHVCASEGICPECDRGDDAKLQECDLCDIGYVVKGVCTECHAHHPSQSELAQLLGDEDLRDAVDRERERVRLRCLTDPNLVWFD